MADNYQTMTEVARYAVGDRVLKHSGDYQLAGEVRAVFTTKRGKVRYVVEHDVGILHIYSNANLRLDTPPDATQFTHWVSWQGGDCPLAESTWHEVMLRNGRAMVGYSPAAWRWKHVGGSGDIVAYRVRRGAGGGPDVV